MEGGYLFNSRYRLLRGTGIGPLTIVYEAHDMALDRLVTVKTLRPEFSTQPEVARRFQQEGQRIANLSHPNLAAVYEVSSDGETLYLVTECLPAGSLRDRLDRDGVLAVDRALDIAIAIAAGVAACHAQGILHGNLKPQNVLLTEQEDVKVTDGGMARVLAAAPMEREFLLREPAAYLTPEEVTGQSLTPASDVYALGLIFYEMLTGCPPFQAKSSTETALLHLRQEVPPLQERNPRVPAPLARIIHKMLTKDPRGRYSSAQQLHHILLTYQRQRAQLNQRAEPAPVSISRVEAVREPPLRAPPSTSEVEYAGKGVDWFFIFLALLAVLAILGLVILWTIVYRSYTMPLG